MIPAAYRTTPKYLITVLVLSLLFFAAVNAIGAYEHQQYVDHNSATLSIGYLDLRSPLNFCGHSFSQGPYYSMACVFTPSTMTLYVNASAYSTQPATYLGHMLWIVDGHTYDLRNNYTAWETVTSFQPSQDPALVLSGTTLPTYSTTTGTPTPGENKQYTDNGSNYKTTTN